MFRPENMKRVELVVPDSIVVQVTEALAASHVFHPAASHLPQTDHIPPGGEDWREQAATFANLERRVLAVMEDLGVSEGPPPEETPHLIEPEVARVDLEHLEQQVEGPVRQLEEQQERLEQLQEYVRQLQTIADLDVELEALRNRHYLYALMGTMPTVNLARLRSSLDIIPSVLVEMDRHDHLATVILFGAQRDAEILDRAARSAYLKPLDLPETYRGTPAEVLEALRAGIERTRRRVREGEATIRRIHQARVDHLRHLLWRVRASRTIVETIARYGQLRNRYVVIRVIEGWVPESQLPALEERMAEVSDQVVLRTNDPEKQDEGEVPVALNNPGLLKPFQDLVTNYGYPSYRETDPTLVTALTFSLLFGAMFGDVGHGLLLLLAGFLLISTQSRSVLRSLRGVAPLLIACGFTGAVFGALYGSIFGFEHLIQPLWLRPVDGIQTILIGTVTAGAALLSLGMIYNLVNALLVGDVGRLLFGHNGLSGLVLYWSLLGLVAGRFVGRLPIPSGVFLALAAVCGTALALDEILANLVNGQRPLAKGGWGTSLIEGFFILFETAISLFSNTLSFVRVGAFAVAHGALGLMILILANRIGPGQGFAYWGVVAVGNLFLVAFEGLVVGIQTLRLEYYEFFGRFFSGSGVRYSPLTLLPREQ